MSKRKDIERAARGAQFRNGAMVHVEPGTIFDRKKYSGKILTCGKCHRVFTEAMAEAHLQECQPNGAICAKCGKKFLPHEFIGHFRKCMGIVQAVEHAD